MRVLTHRQLAPLGRAGFRYLCLSTLASSLGTLLAAIALAIDVKDRTNSGLWVGAVLVVEFLPTILIGLFLGPLLDRLERRSLMISADVVRAGVFAALPFAGNAATIVGLAFVAGLATGFFRPAVYAGIPNLVPDEQLASANAILQTIDNGSWAVGPVLGGLLTAAAGPSAAYWLNAVSFAVSAALIARIAPRLLQSATALTRGHWRDLGDGFVAVMRSRPLLAVLVGWGIASLGIGGGNVSEIFLAKNTFHAGDFGYGLLYSAIGAGLVVGSASSGAVLRRLGIARAYGVGLSVMALGWLGTATSPTIWVAAAFGVVAGVGNGTAIVCNAMLVQRGAVDAMRGRALTFVMSATYVVTGIGNGVAGALLHISGPRWIWGGGAGCIAVAAAAGYLLARNAPEYAVRVSPELAPSASVAD